MMKSKQIYLVGIVLLIIVVIIALSTKQPRKRDAMSVFRMSTTHARSIAQACTVYAMNHQDQFPDPARWKELIAEQENESMAYFESPGSDTGDVSYILLPSVDLFDKKSILLYEEPGLWEQGVIVIFGDAHSEIIPHADFERMLAEQLANTTP